MSPAILEKPMIPPELQDKTVADVIDLLSRGRIGHRAAMDFFGVETYAELVAIMHFNGARMPGHRERKLSAETLELFALAVGREARRGGGED